MSETRAILFDLDGTFADTAPDLGRAVNRMRAEHGLEPLAIDAMRARASSGARGLLAAGFGLTPESEGYKALRDRFLDLYAESLCVETQIFDGILELLAEIEARRLPWGIVTNKARRFTDPLLRELAIDGRAACVVSGDSTPHIKPHPAPLLLAASLLSVAAADCLYIGDDLRDVQAARAAGMRVVVAGWGYLGKGEDPRSWEADGVISHPLQVLDLLQDAA